MQHWLIQFGMNHQYLVYIPIVAVAIVEGPVLSMAFGVLLRLGYFSFLPVYAALMLGDVIGDVGWYYVGYHYGQSAIKRFGARFGVTEEKVEKAKKLFHENKAKILFVSKITNGLGFSVVVLMTAGLVRIPFKKYFAINMAGQVVWSGALLAVGYFLSDSYLRINSIVGKAFLGLVVAIALFAIFLYTKSLRAKFAK